MFFQKKIDATMDWLKNKNGQEDVEAEELDSYIDREEENDIKLERKDILALYISALLVFSPVLIILILVLIWSLY